MPDLRRNFHQPPIERLVLLLARIEAQRLAREFGPAHYFKELRDPELATDAEFSIQPPTPRSKSR